VVALEIREPLRRLATGDRREGYGYRMNIKQMALRPTVCGVCGGLGLTWFLRKSLWSPGPCSGPAMPAPLPFPASEPIGGEHMSENEKRELKKVEIRRLDKVETTIQSGGPNA
jgi:hypothetical protein